MSKEIEILKEAGLDTKAGADYTGGGDKYISAVQTYYKSYGKKSAAIAGYLEAKDYESYKIAVHALKSNSRMIGATELSLAFEELEKAASEGAAEIIESKHAPTLTAYAGLIEKLRPIGEMGEVRIEGQLDSAEAKAVAKDLLDALDDFDDDLSKELVKKLSGYPFRPTRKELLEKASGYIDDFMYDEAAELINEILPAIE